MSIDGTERARLFGVDLSLRDQAQGFDLTLDPAGDLALAPGNDNIVQALTLRLRVRRGELAPLGVPDYGSRLHELIGQPNNDRTRTVLMAHARNALLEDPRVAGVTKVTAVAPPGERDVVRLELEILLVDERTPMNLVLDVALGVA